MFKAGGKDSRFSYILAGGAALVGAILMQTHISKQLEKPKMEAEKETYMVVSAVKALESGAELAVEDIKLVPVRMSQVPRHLFDAGLKEGDGKNQPGWEQLKHFLAKRRLCANVKKDDLLLRTDFEEEAEASLAQNIRPNLRGVTVTVDKGSLMGGLLMPNDRVDVIAYYPVTVYVDNRAEKKYEKANVILKNVTVLSVGGRMSRTQEKGSYAGSGGESAVVLGLVPDEALALSLVLRGAKLSLLMRSTDSGDNQGDYTVSEIEAPDVETVLKHMAGKQ